ncbi:hypothetical protein GCM10025783_30250 [Amnibacterium soli]|uniref:Uncharacterized protein n=1 Tax=Amnibacterium soli TaxID=1282736 RepID=A0ABP8ZFR3_9MICO
MIANVTRSRERRSALSWTASLVCLLALTGCAPNALGFEHDDTIRQSFTATNGRAWGGVFLDNMSGDGITLQDLRIRGLTNARISSIKVIRISPGNAIGFYPTDLTPGMQQEFQAAHPLHGFRLPAHSRDAYEAVLLVAAIDRSRDASTTDAVVTYRSGGSSWSETRRSSFCLAVKRLQGCAAWTNPDNPIESTSRPEHGYSAISEACF